MSYQHIDNLYKTQDILLFKECYALEKIHGTSAHVSWNEGKLDFFSGGANYDQFVAWFDVEKLTEAFRALGHAKVVVFGEAYGGKCQGMSATYGKTLRFVAFEVKIEETWLDVPNAEDVVRKLGLEFVHYNKIPTDLEAIDAERDAPSEQAKRNGIEEPRLREGVVLRPPIEVRTSNGSRIVAKHKRPEFAERATVPDVDPTKREMMVRADAIALEWVTEMRLTHVLDTLGNPTDLTAYRKVIQAMVDDVCREAAGEIVESTAARKAIGARAVKLYNERLAKGFPND
jgi:hypothetical protein